MQGQMDHGLANARFNEQQENIAPILDALRQYGSGVAERVSAFAEDPAQALYGGFADTMGINLDRPMDEYAEMARNPQAGEIDPNSPAVLEAMGWLPGPMGALGTIAGKGAKLPMDEASRMQRAQDMGFDEEVYKGMYPYDWTKEKGDYLGPEITEINRNSPFPAFGGEDGDVEGIAGFMSPSKEIANKFAERGGTRQAVYPLMYKKGNQLIIDAKGEYAGKIQFGDSGQPFRNAVRSGEYDTIRIVNTKDEGDVIVALDPKNIRSKFAKFDPSKKESANLLAGLGGLGMGINYLGSSEDAAETDKTIPLIDALRNKEFY